MAVRLHASIIPVVMLRRQMTVVSQERMLNRETKRKSVCVNLGWRILRIVLFSLLGVLVACVAALIAFMVVR